MSIKKGVTKLQIDIDQFAVDLHFFFKFSAARREDCSKMQDLTVVTSNYVLRHSSARCLTLTLPVPCISESCIEIKINLNFYFHTSLWCLKRFYEGLLRHHKKV